ncbi:MAG: tetratricopeptide repeat protein [Pirellulales bacterium]
MVALRRLLAAFLLSSVLHDVMTSSSCMAAEETSSPAARAAYSAAAALQNRQAWELAAEEWDLLISQYPADPLALKGRFYLGICQLKNDNWPAAQKSFRSVIESDADDATKLLARWELARGSFIEAQSEQRSKSYKTAASFLREYLASGKDQPHRDEALFCLGESLWQSADKEQAIKTWTRFTQEHQSSTRLPDVLYALGVGQSEMGQWDDAIKSFQQFTTSFPDHELIDDVGIWHADAAINIGDDDEVERVLEPLALTQGARQIEALERLAAFRWKQKRWAEAAEAYLDLAKREEENNAPEDRDAALVAMASAGRAFIEAKTPDKARPLLEKAIQAPGDVGFEAAHSLIILELDADNPQKALAIATNAIAQWDKQANDDETKLAQLELDRADALWEIPEKRADAARAYSLIAEKYPKHGSIVLAALAMSSLAMLDQGRPEEALRSVKTFLEHPASPKSDRLLDVKSIEAEAFLALGKYAASSTAYHALLKEYPQADQRPTWQIREAVALSAAKQWQEVHDRLERALPKLKSDLKAEALLLDAMALVELKQPEAAIPQLNLIETHHDTWSRRDEALLLDVRARRESGDEQGAIKKAKRLVRTFPNSRYLDIAWYRYGQLLQESGQYETAIQAFRNVLSKKPQGTRAPWASLALGWCFEAQDKLPQAIKEWSVLITAYSDSNAAKAALLARGDALYREGSFESGLQDAKGFLNSVQQNKNASSATSEAHFLSGLCLMGLKQYKKAIQEFRTILDTQPSFASADRVAFEMGTAQLLSGQKKDAEKTFHMVVSKYPQGSRTADAWFEIGEARFEAKAWDDATDAYEHAIESVIDRDVMSQLLEQALHKRGWSSAMKKDHGKATQAFAEQVRQFPDGRLAADGFAMLGESFFQSGNHAAAREPLNKALATIDQLSSPDLQGLALIRAGECAALQGDWKKSLTLSEQLLNMQPDSPYTPQARYAAAWAQQNLGQLDKALSAYQAIANTGQTVIAARARMMEGEILFEQGNHKDAIKAFFKVAYGFGEKQAPQSFHAWQAQSTYEAARCFEALGKPNQAENLYAELLDRYPSSAQAPQAKLRLAALHPPSSP